MRTMPVAGMLTAACVMAALSGVAGAAQGAEKTTWDGVYADAQARTGEALYNDRCAQCHGPDATGGNAPAFVGAEFATGWDGMALSDLFQRMKATAPASSPGSLTRDEVASLMAYILELNGFPSGPTDLPNGVELLKPIRFVLANPKTAR